MIETEIRRVIRDARASDPIISNTGIQQVLEKRFNREFSYNYVAKLARKVHTETLKEASRTKIEARLSVTRERFRIGTERLLQIINWQPTETLEALPGETIVQFKKRVSGPKDEDVIEAVKVLGMLDLALLKAEIECGVYKDEATALAEHRTYTMLPDDQRNSIVSAFNKWGYLSSGTVAKLTERTITVYAGNGTTNPTA